jgi:hypothetical protein
MPNMMQLTFSQATLEDIPVLLDVYMADILHKYPMTQLDSPQHKHGMNYEGQVVTQSDLLTRMIDKDAPVEDRKIKILPDPSLRVWKAVDTTGVIQGYCLTTIKGDDVHELEEMHAYPNKNYMTERQMGIFFLQQAQKENASSISVIAEKNTVSEKFCIDLGLNPAPGTRYLGNEAALEFILEGKNIADVITHNQDFIKHNTLDNQ